MSSPIGDLSYRNLSPSSVKQSAMWAIARNVVRMSLKKRMFWVMTAFSAWWYLILIITVYIFEQIVLNGQGNGIWVARNFFKNIQWGDQMVHAMAFGQIFVLFIALLVGSGAIANDNRANALLVYFGKPCTKLDYVLGKWLGIFLMLVMAIGIPHVAFYLYGALSYHEHGFLTKDPLMIVRLLGATVLNSAFYASLVLGVSSLFNQGRIAGAVIAAFYFLSNLFTQVVMVTIISKTMHFVDGPGGRGRMMMQVEEAPAGLLRLFYMSIDGSVNGMTKIVMAFKQTNWSLWGPGRAPALDAPPGWMAFAAYFIIIVGGFAIAHARVRAVEIVS